jgi:DNA adenine methylase
MKYMGSKNRIAKDIMPLILRNKKQDQYYIEPFCGGCNTIDKVHGLRIASDVNPYLIALYNEINKGWIPPQTFQENEYNNIKNNKEQYEPYLVGYIGFALSYGGKWFGGWRRDSEGKRDYVLEAYKNMITQIPNLLGIAFECCSYTELTIPENSIVYCDPPYKNTTKYKDKFNHDNFFKWCRDIKNRGNQVFVSEYNAPDDFICIYEKQITSSLTKNTGSKIATEKLFTL